MIQEDNKRIDAVQQFLQIDFNRSAEFQNIVDLAAELCETPVSLITLLDKDIDWIKARSGIDIEMMPRETSFCQYTIQQSDILVIPDTHDDDRFNKNPLVTDAPNVRFYAGAPLVVKGGIRVGSLCLFDAKPNNINIIQQKALSTLSKQVTFLMELELSQKILQQYIHDIEQQNDALRSIAAIQSHDVRQPLTSIMGLLNLIKDDGYKAGKEQLQMMEEAANELDRKIHEIVDHTGVNT